jgi:Pentapeptide repeats (9 copies)
MSPQVEAAIIAGCVGILTLIGTVIAQIVGFRSTGANTERQINAQREQLEVTLKAQSEQLKQTLTEQRTRTLNERFATAAEQLGSDKPAVRLAGVYAMAGLADDWEENRQTCVDVLCAYLRMPYEPDPGEDAPEPQQLAFQAIREVRHTVIRVITAHLQKDAEVSWQGLNFDFNGVMFDGGDFRGAEFSGGMAVFDNAKFSGGTVRFNRAKFSGGEVYFGNAKFSGGRIRFEGAKFSGGTVSFRHIELSGGAFDFGRAEFSGGRVSFDGAGFSGGTVDFTHAEFSGGEVDFSGASDWSFPPAFPWTDTPPPGVELPRKEDQSQA